MWKKVNFKNVAKYLKKQDPGFLTGLVLGLLIGAVGSFLLFV
jgi:hypothetical protein